MDTKFKETTDRLLYVGNHRAVAKFDTDAPYGYYEYLPFLYHQNNYQFPLVLFLHGAGEVGDSRTNPDVLKRVLKHGIPFLISKNLWKPAYPFVVISPQNDVYGWDAVKMRRFLEYVCSNYTIDLKRIYMTGISMGAFGIFSYLGRYGDKSGIAAAVPICGGGDIQNAQLIKHTPVWAFHGNADNIVNVQYSIEMISAINRANPKVRAQLSIFPKVKHNSWTITYSGAGMGKEQPGSDKFDMPIWEWMYRYRLGTE
jgi:predicted peptidase